MRNVEVNLTWSEVWQASLVAIQRRILSMKRGSKTQEDNGLNLRKSEEVGSWNDDINGALGEMAYAKATGQYWGGDVDTFKAPDVGTVQVRATDWANGHLILRPWDEGKADQWFVLVTVQKSSERVTSNSMRCVVCGGRFGGDVMAGGRGGPFWREDSWWLPQEELEDFDG